MLIAEQARVLASLSGTVAILGGLAGGLLSRDGWKTLGAVVGAIAMGLVGVVTTLHPTAALARARGSLRSRARGPSAPAAQTIWQP